MNDFNPKTEYDEMPPETMECNYVLWKDILTTVLLIAVVALFIIVLPEFFQ